MNFSYYFVFLITRCPNCLAIRIKKNGKKSCGKQNYQCKNCHRQFIHQLELAYKGCLSQMDAKIRLMLVRSCSIADIVAFVWGKRNLATAKQLRERFIQMGISFDHIRCDKWDSFLVAFELDNKLIGKQFTVGIEGNNNRIRHRIRRAFRKTCCFSKRLINHVKAFNLVFHYINYGWV